MDPFPCPRCKRPLTPAGTVEVEGVSVPYYQCDECVVPWVVEGQVFDAAYTFAIGRDGQPFDPAEAIPDTF